LCRGNINGGETRFSFIRLIRHGAHFMRVISPRLVVKSLAESREILEYIRRWRKACKGKTAWI